MAAAAPPQPGRQWRLVRQILPGTGMRPVTLDIAEFGGDYTLGRLEDPPRVLLQFPLGSNFISKRHCTILWRNGVWRLLDHNSLNGTFLNGVRIAEERELRENDRVGLGVDTLTPILPLPPPLDSYYIFTFQQAGVAVAGVQFLPPAPPVKVELIETITLDSDDEEPQPGPSSSSSSLSRRTLPLLTPASSEVKDEEKEKKLREEDERSRAMAAATAAQKRRREEKESRRKAEEEEAKRKQLAKEEAGRKRREAADRKRLAIKMEAEKLRKAEEETKREVERQAVAAAERQKKLEEEETERKRKEDAEMKLLAMEEAEKKRKLEVEEALRVALRRAAVEKQREEEAERKRKEAVEVKQLADEAQKQQEREEAEEARKAAAEKQRKEEEAAEAQREAEAEARKKKRDKRLERRIAAEQLADLQREAEAAKKTRLEIELPSTPSSSDVEMEKAESPIDRVVEITRKNQVIMTSKILKGKKTPSSSPTKNSFKRIRRVESSSESEAEDLDFVAHDSNPYVGSNAASPQPVIDGTPQILTESASAAVLEKVVSQFTSSYMSNNKRVDPGSSSSITPLDLEAPHNYTEKSKKRKTPDDSCNRGESIPKKIREEAPLSAASIWSVPPPTAPRKQQPLPVASPSIPNSSRPPSVQAEKPTPLPKISTMSLPPPPKPNHAAFPAQAQPQTSIQVSPAAAKPQHRWPKDLNTAIDNVYNKKPGHYEGRIKLLDIPAALPVRKRQQHRPDPTRKQPQNPFPPGGPGRKEKLKELTVKNKQKSDATESPRPTYRGGHQSTVKTKMTGLSRSDKLLGSMKSSAVPATSKTSFEKPKATVAPLQPRTDSGDLLQGGPVAKIIHEMGNNRLSQVIEKPTGAPNLNPQGRGVQQTSSSSLPQKTQASPAHSKPKPKTASATTGGNLAQKNGSLMTSSATVLPGASVSLKPPPPTTTTVTAATTTSVVRLPEDQVYRDALMWNPQWLQAPSPWENPSAGVALQVAQIWNPTTQQDQVNQFYTAVAYQQQQIPPLMPPPPPPQLPMELLYGYHEYVPLCQQSNPVLITPNGQQRRSFRNQEQEPRGQSQFQGQVLMAPATPTSFNSSTVEQNRGGAGMEQGAIAKPPPVNHEWPILTNLPIYKDYESYKNTFYPLMLLELWASIFQESTSKEKDNFSRPKSRLGMDSVELPVGIEHFEAKHGCPLLLNLNQQETTHRRQKAQGRGSEEKPFYHCFRLVALVERHGELNRERDFGTITFNFKRSNGEIRPLTFFAFFQEPQYEEITSMTLIPECLKKEQRSKKFKVTVQMTTHIKYDVNKLVRENAGRMKKICYISSKIRDFRALSQLPDSTLFQQILSPPTCSQEQVMSNDGVSRSELVADTYAKLNPVQRSVVHHISRRVLNGPGPDMMLLHGPPGTGKTRTIVGLIMQLTIDYRWNNPDKQMKLLVCTPSNTAVDEIIRRLMQDDNGLKIVRIGGGSVSEDTKKYMLEEVAKPYMTKAGQIESINQSIRNTDRKIEKAKGEIGGLKAADDKNGTVISSLEANIIEWQRDRKMYICDLNSVRSDRKGMDQAKRSVILNSQVVFSTLNSCSSGQLRRPSKPSRSGGTGQREETPQESALFTCCIVDEATQTTEPESLAPLMLGCEKLILVGDPKQLPATVLSSEAESKKFRQSLFTRIFNHYEDSCGGANPVMMLTTQYRMHREILKWPNEWFYGKRLVTHSSVDARPPLRIRPYIFLNIASKESNFQNGQISNDEEVKYLRVILQVLNGFALSHPHHRGLSIGIITPYNEQRKKVCQIVNEIKKVDLRFGNSIEVDTVDSFQGREKDIILLSCVRTHDLGFVKTPERLNVALTRAKQSLIIVGNAVCLNSNSMWKNLMDDATERDDYHSINSSHGLRGEAFLTEYIKTTISLPL